MLIKFTSQTTDVRISPVKVFYSYSHKDERFRKNLVEHLSVLKRQGFIDEWHDRKIMPGEEWRGQIDKNLESADIILLLISSSFIASDYCYDVEMTKALSRHEAGSSIVIPIILRPVFWQIAPFAKLQAVPKDGKPIATFKLKDEAYLEITEKLRSRIVELKDSSITNEAKEIHKWHWIIKFPSSYNIDDKKSNDIIFDLRKISGDNELNIAAFGENKSTLIIQGDENSFRKVEKLYNEKRLLEIDHIPIISLYIAYGAEIQSSSSLTISDNATNEFENLLYRSRKYSPMLLKGIFVSDKKPLSFDFIMDLGDESGHKKKKEESERLISYFLAALAVNEDDLWVNLSAYEGNRMIPKNLSGTQLGRDLLAQDCLLKQLTASLIHPDTEIGKQYWKEVYQRSYSLFGTTKIPIKTFQKVWLKPEKATVFETNLPRTFQDSDSEIIKAFANKEGKLAYIVNDKLLALCEEDYFALQQNIPKDESINENEIQQKYKDINDFTLPIFREIVLPAIQEEIDTCLNFKLIRQIYFSIILATWYKKNCTNHSGYNQLVGTNKPTSINPTILSINKFPSSTNRKEIENLKIHDFQSIRDGALSINDYTSFDVKENKEFYTKYLKLFEKGIFNVIRKEFDPFSESVVTRSYFSGKVTFKGLNIQKSSNISMLGRQLNNTIINTVKSIIHSCL